MKVEAIAIKHTKYKEYNAMMTLLTKDKILSFQAFGVYKPFHKNFLLVTPLMFANFVFSDSKSYLSLKEVNPIVDTRCFILTPALGCTINALTEIVNLLLLDEDKPKIYPYLEAALRKINTLTTTSSYKAFTALLICFAKAISISGYALEVDKCVITNSTKDIVGISLIDGGFISKSVYDPNKHIKYSKDKIAILRGSFKATPECIKEWTFDPVLAREIIKDLIIYVKDTTNTTLKSVALIDYVTV